jgi:hypothetical protein
MMFTNEEVSVVIDNLGPTTIEFQTFSGNAAYMPIPAARAVTLTVETVAAATRYKLDRLNYCLSQGYRVEFWLPNGNYLYSTAVKDIAEIMLHFTHASIIYEGDGESSRQGFRGHGLMNRATTTITVKEGVYLTVPTSTDIGIVTPPPDDLPID